MLTLLGLAAVIATAVFGASAQASSQKLLPPLISIRLLPAPAGATVRTINVYLTNPNNRPSGKFLFSVVPGYRKGHNLELSVKLVGYKAVVSKNESATKTGHYYIMGGSNLGPHQVIHFSTTYRAADIKAGMCTASVAYWIGPPVISSNSPHAEICWNIS